MGTLQTMLALVLLIFILSVIAQWIQEIVKAALGTKANVMKATIDKFMGERLPTQQVENALARRGLDITTLEHFSTRDFRHLLDAVTLPESSRDLIVSAGATAEQIKDNIAASYEAARALFQKAYTTRNRWFALAISFGIVIALNANLIKLYEQISADQIVQQAIVGKATAAPAVNKASDQSQPADLASVYRQNRDDIAKALKDYPVLVRTYQYKQDFREGPASEIAGLLLMGILVSLGAPFWNDVLKGMTGLNDTLNTSRAGSS